MDKYLAEECAVFLPAVSGFYTAMLDSYWNKKVTRLPDTLSSFEELNFLDPDKGLIFHSAALYSAGHAKLDLNRCHNPDWATDRMIHQRDRSKVTLVGDSGGFQIGKGVIKFDWEHFFEKPGDPGYIGDADKIRMNIINWLEDTMDWAMTLDVPSWAAKNPKIRERSGLKDQNDCLKATVFNLEFFMKHKQGKTKWLNVLQGTEWEDAQEWYEAVKGFDTQGWAMGGNNSHDMIIILKRIFTLRDDGLLQDRDWIHFLGTAKIRWAVALTAVMRQIRKHINPKITVSFDCASPFIATANGMVYTTSVFTSDRFGYLMKPCLDDKVLKGSKIPFPFSSKIGEKLVLGDICQYGMNYSLVEGEIRQDLTKEEVEAMKAEGVNAEWIEADINRANKIGATSWDTTSYAFLMMHNVETHIDAVRRGNILVDMEYQSTKPNWRDWRSPQQSLTTLKKKTKNSSLSILVPSNLLYFISFLEDLFVADDPYTMIDENAALLRSLNSMRHKSDVLGNPLFNDLFECGAEIAVEVSDDTFDMLDPDSKEMDRYESINKMGKKLNKKVTQE